MKNKETNLDDINFEVLEDKQLLELLETFQGMLDVVDKGGINNE